MTITIPTIPRMKAAWVRVAFVITVHTSHSLTCNSSNKVYGDEEQHPLFCIILSFKNHSLGGSICSRMFIPLCGDTFPLKYKWHSDSFCKLIFVTLSESHTFDVMEHFAVAQCHRKEHNGKVDRKENRVRSYIIMKMVQIVIPVLVVRINIRIIANAS